MYLESNHFLQFIAQITMEKLVEFISTFNQTPDNIDENYEWALTILKNLFFSSSANYSSHTNGSARVRKPDISLKLYTFRSTKSTWDCHFETFYFFNKINLN